MLGSENFYSPFCGKRRKKSCKKFSAKIYIFNLCSEIHFIRRVRDEREGSFDAFSADD